MSVSSATGIITRLRPLGFLFIITGVIGGPVLGVWLSFRGDIVEVLHRLKMSLPGGGWLVLKYSLSIAVGILFVTICVAIGFVLLSWGCREQAPPGRNFG